MKPAKKIPIRALLISLLAIEIAGFFIFKHQARSPVPPPAVRGADLATSELARSPRATVRPVSSAKVEDPGFAALVEPAPLASADAPAADAKDALCGGIVCRPDQFCCGPPACGHCVSALRGPRCPKTCP